MSIMKSKKIAVPAHVSRIRKRYSDAWRDSLVALLNEETSFNPVALRVVAPLFLALDKSSRIQRQRFNATRNKIRELLSDLVKRRKDDTLGVVPHELSLLAQVIKRGGIETEYQIENIDALPVRPEVIAIGEPFRFGPYTYATVKTIEKDDAVTRLFALISQVLDHGLLAKLRSCKHCKKLLIAKKSDREFCYNSNCADAYHNALKTKDGTWKTARKKARVRP
jgi:hypothetical protein